jgi:hypothetical protein
MRNDLANAMNPSMSLGGVSPWFTQSEALHRDPSMGMMIPKRLLPGGVGTCSTKSQSVGASSGFSKTLLPLFSPFDSYFEAARFSQENDVLKHLKW